MRTSGSPFLPHTIMGLSAGLVGRRSAVAGSLTILVGHVLNIVAFILAGLLPASDIIGKVFLYGLAFETVVDIVVILAAVPLIRPLVQRGAPAQRSAHAYRGGAGL